MHTPHNRCTQTKIKTKKRGLDMHFPAIGLISTHQVIQCELTHNSVCLGMPLDLVVAFFFRKKMPQHTLVSDHHHPWTSFCERWWKFKKKKGRDHTKITGWSYTAQMFSHLPFHWIYDTWLLHHQTHDMDVTVNNHCIVQSCMTWGSLLALLLHQGCL